jgi:hypothetical protein
MGMTTIGSRLTTHGSENEVTILARILGNENGQLPRDIARYVVDLNISERDKARMHDLAVRNQDDDLTPAEKEEMFAFGKEARQNNLSIRGSERSRNRDHPSFHGTDYSVEPPKAATLLSILKSKARRTLGIKLETRTVS